MIRYWIIPLVLGFITMITSMIAHEMQLFGETSQVLGYIMAGGFFVFIISVAIIGIIVRNRFVGKSSREATKTTWKTMLPEDKAKK